MCIFLLGLIFLCLITNLLLNHLKNKTKKQDDPKIDKKIDIIVNETSKIDPKAIERKHMKLVKELNIDNPTESQNKFAFKIFKYFSQKNKGLFCFTIIIFFYHINNLSLN